MADAVRVEMFMDVSCPWCHGALETSRRILDEFAADQQVPAIELQWRFMRLHPMPREGGMPIDECLASWAPDESAVARARENVRDYARSVGTRVDYTRYTYMHDPITAHRLLAAVRDDDSDDLPSLWSLSRAVWSGNFVAGADISDLAALRGVTERAGLAVPRRVWEQLAGDGHLAETLVDHQRALEVELDGVPRMYVGGRIVPTWIDADEVRRQLREAIAAAATTMA